MALAALIGRLAYIQVSLGPALLQWSERRQCSTVPLPGRRGAILDRRGRVLAGSHDRPTVYADPRHIPDRAAAAQELARVLGIPASEIQRLLDHPTSSSYVVIRRGIGANEANGVHELAIPGIGLQNEPVRTYPMGSLAAHVLGFVGAESEGLEGIERALDARLRAKPGHRTVYRDAQRRAIFQRPDSYIAPRDGLHVVLTLDAAIQEILETEIRKAVDQFKAEGGLGVILCPKTGAVLAMACWPTFDLREAHKVTPELRRNRVLTDPVEPGSIFKPFVMLEVLAEHLAQPSETIFCHNGLYVTGSRRLHDHHPYGNLTVEQVVTKSSNIGMAILGQRLGNTRMRTALERLGFGQPTGIELSGESGGLLMPLKAWNSFSTTSVPMGQELAVTPIQIATAFCALANGGHLVRPHVVGAVLGHDGEVIQENRRPEDRGAVANPAAVATLREMLLKVVTEGTGRPCLMAKWQVLGKTGTAQIPRLGRRGYEPNAYLASFIAAAPASDPAVVTLVMIRKPDRRIAYYGGTVAGPTVKAILEQVLSYLAIPPDKSESDESRLAWHGRGSGDLSD